ncbi:MAG: hypothetical protein JWO24_3875 [Rhodospirillales bacterium]|jgi:hypothetical protein|nr:hypothetical protein [Rhodospirillales bacterium]
MTVAKIGASVWPVRVAGAIAITIAIGLGFAAWKIGATHHRMARAGVAVEGRMTGAYREVRARGAPSLYPTVSYRTTEGRVIVGGLEHSVDMAEIQRRRVVALRYDPDAPERVHLASAMAGARVCCPGSWPALAWASGPWD